MNQFIFRTTLALAAATPLVLRADDLPENPNRFSFGPTFGLNFKAQFRNNAALYNNVTPGPAGGGANHNYNDGYVLVDGSGNAGGVTGNWGYKNPSQVVGDTMQFHAIQTQNSSSITGDPQMGFELNYQRVIGHLCAPSIVWGLETGLGVTEIDLRENFNGTLPVTTDTFQLNGVIPPGAGYNGTFAGPGPLLGDTPTRTTTLATRTGYQKLSGQLVTIRLGPFAEWNLTDKLSLSASAGLALAPTMLDYDFSETATLPGGGGTYAARGHSSKTELLYGPYAGAMLRYDITRRWGLYVGARFQNLTGLNQSAGSRTARFDPGCTVNLTVGATWKF